MIRLSKINKEFDIYKKRKLVIWGCGLFGKKLLDVFNNLNIDVFAFCDNNQELWGGTKKHDISIISPKELEYMIVKNNEDITIQMGLANHYEIEVLEQIKDWGNIEIISYQEAWQVLGYIQKLIYLENHNNIVLFTNQEDLWYRTMSFKKRLKRYMYENSNEDYYLILCLPPKTGDLTLCTTFDNNSIKYINIYHATQALDNKHISINKSNKKVKIITAVREPVSQSISYLYQLLSISIIIYII